MVFTVLLTLVKEDLDNSRKIVALLTEEDATDNKVDTTVMEVNTEGGQGDR
jgi:hypothetical protein